MLGQDFKVVCSTLVVKITKQMTISDDYWWFCATPCLRHSMITPLHYWMFQLKHFISVKIFTCGPQLGIRVIVNVFQSFKVPNKRNIETE